MTRKGSLETLVLYQLTRETSRALNVTFLYFMLLVPQLINEQNPSVAQTDNLI